MCRNVQSQCRYKSDQDEAEPVKFTQKHPLKEEKLCHGNEKPGTLRQQHELSQQTVTDHQGKYNEY